VKGNTFYIHPVLKDCSAHISVQGNQLISVKVAKVMVKCPLFKNNITPPFYNTCLETVMSNKATSTWLLSYVDIP
jgi:hypothetical protein